MGVMRHKAPIVKMVPNRAKIIEAILFLISEADKSNKPITQCDIVKSIFLADRRHLNEFGRPVTFDNYCAMEHGPVPSLAYDILKSTDDFPWTRSDTDTARKNYHTARRAVDEDVLSPSDMKVLSDALTTVRSLGFGQIKKLTHEDPAYVDAWDPEEGRAAFEMSYSLLFDAPNVEKSLDLAHASKHI